MSIIHGNTVVNEQDTKSEWYNNRSASEGGIINDININKFDVIVGNPPYTHLRNLDNRRYAAYPKQRDMAQVFVRWAFDHLTKDGVIGYNTTDTWLTWLVSETYDQIRKCLTEDNQSLFQLIIWGQITCYLWQ